jgi:thiamine phosphate synthase YjbQ (UPF0047 family)
MKVHTAYIQVQTEQQQDFLNITDKVAQAVTESGINEGLVLINPQHITSSMVSLIWVVGSKFTMLNLMVKGKKE